MANRTAAATSAALVQRAIAGAYVSFLTDADQDRVRAFYGAAKYERLARIKARYDPDNLFHPNANIRPFTRRTP